MASEKNIGTAGSILKTAMLFAVPYALAQIIGRAMYQTNTLSGAFDGAKASFLTCVEFAAVAAATGAVMFLILKLISNTSFEAGSLRSGFFVSRGAFFRVWPVIFLCWVPCWLAYYPGVFSYDIITQTEMIIEGRISSIVPPLHTLIWKVCLYLDDSTKSRIVAIVVYSVFQMLTFSAALASVTVTVARKTASAAWALAALAFFALNPVVALMSFMTTKAVLFSALFALLSVQLWCFSSSPERFFSESRRPFLFSLTLLAASLFRGNAVFSFIPVLFPALKHSKGFRKQTALMFCVPVALYFIISTLGFRALGISGGGKGELFPVPYQQIACVTARHGDELTQEDYSGLDLFTDSSALAGKYNPRFSDPVKSSFSVSPKSFPQFVRLWLSLGLRYPGDYLDAFLTLNLPYWYPEADSVDRFAQRDYIETRDGGYGFYWVFRNSKLPSLLKFYDSAADFSLFRGKPVVEQLFSISSPIWIVAFCLAVLSVRNMRALKTVLLPSFFQWLIFIFGPVSNLRYIFPVMVLYPVFFAMVFSGNNSKAAEVG